MKTTVEEKNTYNNEKKKWRGHHTHLVPKEDIAVRAYEIWQEHGRTDGHDREDWLQSEEELHGHCSTLMIVN
jgi:hypothetical protein